MSEKEDKPRKVRVARDIPVRDVPLDIDPRPGEPLEDFRKRRDRVMRSSK